MKTYLFNLMWMIVGLISLPLWWIIAAAIGLLWLIRQALVQLYNTLFAINVAEHDVDSSTLSLD